MDCTQLAVDFLQNIRPMLGWISLCSEGDGYTFHKQEAVRGSTKLEGAYRISFLHRLTNVALNRTAGDLGQSYGDEDDCANFWIACINEDDGSGIDVVAIAYGVCTTRRVVAQEERCCIIRVSLDMSLGYRTVDWNVPAMEVDRVDNGLEDGASDVFLRRWIVVQQMLQAVRRAVL